MQVPKRKTSKFSYIKPDPHLTREKIKDLERQLERMLQKRPSLAEEVKRLALDGDFSENAPYQSAKGRLRGLNQRILNIHSNLTSAIVIDPQNERGTVQIGSTIEMETAGKIKTLTILGSAETDPRHGIISHNSPIGSALLDKKVGDIIEVKLKDKTKTYTIKKISL